MQSRSGFDFIRVLCTINCSHRLNKPVHILESVESGLVQRLSSDLKIAPEQIVREYWEMALLNALNTESLSASLGFKGGTALRLAYGSPRFSDDLDFSILGKLQYPTLRSWGRRVATKLGIELTDAAAKRNTYLLEFRIRDGALTHPIKQKLEISRREYRSTKSNRSKVNDYELRLLASPVTNLQVLCRVASLNIIWEEKLLALRERAEPRDLFDLWYLSQQLRRPLPSSLPRFSPTVLKRDLHRYLPSSLYPVVQELARR